MLSLIGILHRYLSFELLLLVRNHQWRFLDLEAGSFTLFMRECSTSYIASILKFNREINIWNTCSLSFETLTEALAVVGWPPRKWTLFLVELEHSKSWSTCDILACNAAVASNQLPLFSKTNNCRTDGQHYSITCGIDSTRSAILTHKTTLPPESFAGTTLR
ncbi:hypothetical protein SDJN02_22540 [Cucurbita argyrosperma subsp. argyrosperma]|nr:hypothetical protein SDJN02_22540 [Cucurbita argyrosperma subsp. argyrosperma]